VKMIRHDHISADRPTPVPLSSPERRVKHLGHLLTREERSPTVHAYCDEVQGRSVSDEYLGQSSQMLSLPGHVPPPRERRRLTRDDHSDKTWYDLQHIHRRHTESPTLHSFRLRQGYGGRDGDGAMPPYKKAACGDAALQEGSTHRDRQDFPHPRCRHLHDLSV
jgi:hypothetical protein